MDGHNKCNSTNKISSYLFLHLIIAIISSYSIDLGKFCCWISSVNGNANVDYLFNISKAKSDYWSFLSYQQLVNNSIDNCLNNVQIPFYHKFFENHILKNSVFNTIS